MLTSSQHRLTIYGHIIEGQAAALDGRVFFCFFLGFTNIIEKKDV